MKNIYNLFLIIIFHTILPILSIFFKRIKFWIFIQRKKTALKIQTITKKRIWFHCASVGEYEMIKPIIKYYEVEKNEIIISFFSALAYSHIKNNSNYNCFLFPLDTSYNINETIKKINPKKVIIAKNEIWPNFIISCYKNSIPTYLIATKIKDSRLHNFFYGKFYCSLLNKITGIFVVDENSKIALREKNINSMISGDPRVDQVLYEKKINRKNKIIENFITNKKIILAGSTDTKDYFLFNKLMNSDKKKWIIIPHNISKKDLKYITNKITAKWSLYSEPKDLENSKILIIDKVGILKDIYKYADVVYIGGGFSNGIHNCLEPAVYHKPIIIGPKYKKFPEALFFVKNKICFSVKSSIEFEKNINKMFNMEELKSKSVNFFKKHSGATKTIIKFLSKN
tara:strand:+ start:3575 stop:4768 length:1194 start_codon:yes stop_codon:yes gene_type:complete